MDRRTHRHAQNFLLLWRRHCEQCTRSKMQKVFDELSGDEKGRKGKMVEAFETGQEGSFDVREKKKSWSRAGLGKVQEKFGASWSLLPLLQRPAQASKLWVASVLAVLSDRSPRSRHSAPFYRF